ncbi:hypothetical protein MM221_14965 [Salipaludibacillus sp. LMS25]|uniref:hypothetical protein n=1 Tax=Salipaludibacillus sp. LMS25 TaxID=2924031 RepID=UPI0020D12E4B|nr:hypothetical protein [Salipaludibacillus sp. LMS25]UTR13901.1 hypothetical protein MM221_14965 [Salipaludibacillus sp. LMS25]
MAEIIFTFIFTLIIILTINFLAKFIVVNGKFILKKWFVVSIIQAIIVTLLLCYLFLFFKNILCLYLTITSAEANVENSEVVGVPASNVN